MTSPRSFISNHARDILDGIKRLWWIFVIVAPLTGLGLFIAIDHANSIQARQQERSNQQFRKAQINANRKFQQAIQLSAQQSAYSINKIVCGFRGFIGPTLKSYEAAAKDPTLSSSARARNDKRIVTTRAYLSTLVTVPADFPCEKLPKNPPKAAHP